MILQILADAGKVELHRYPEGAKLLGGTDAGEQQQLRRVDGAAGEHHFPRGPHLIQLAAAHIFNADGAVHLDQYPGRLRLGANGEIFALGDRMQIGRGRAAALAVFLRHLKQTAAELHCAVKIGIERNPGLLRRLEEDVTQRVGVRPLGDVERPVAAVKFVVQALVALGFFEIRQHVRITPARIAELPPVIVVRRLAAHIDHGVDRT